MWIKEKKELCYNKLLGVIILKKKNYVTYQKHERLCFLSLYNKMSAVAGSKYFANIINWQ